jgi:hypothetical protein
VLFIHWLCLHRSKAFAMITKTLLFTFLIVTVNSSLNAQTVEEVISKHIAFTGGEQQWKTVQSIVTSGIYNYGGIEFPFTAYSKRPNLYKFIVPFQGKYFAQSFDGQKGWKIDAFKGETKKTYLSGKPAHALANEADVDLESPFLNYNAKGHAVTLEGKDTASGFSCFKVILTRKNGEAETYYFKETDYSLIKKIAISKNAELDNAMLETYYSDYHTVHGLHIPFTAISRVKDQTILTITIKKAQVNVPLKATFFKG